MAGVIDFLAVSVAILTTMWRGYHRRRGETSRFSGRPVVVLLAILAISASVATRSFHGFYLDHPSVHAHPSHAMRQHLAADAFVPPNATLTPVANLPVATPNPLPVDVRVHTVELAESLYNRPPPSIPLL